MKQTHSGSPAFSRHDHGLCATDALAVARATCAEHKLRLTPIREKVLGILLETHTALGAYDILETLRTEGLRSQPPVAYRALEFLVEHSFAHKIERLNAFIGCTYPEKDHSPVFMICKECNQVAETLSFPIIGTLSKTAKAIGFEIEKAVVETEGTCPGCRKTENS